MKKLLVTGSSGLLGSACVEFFAAKDWKVIGIDSNQRSHFFGTPLKDGSLNIDIRDRVALGELFVEHKFDAIIHAAAQPSHDYATDHIMEDFEINTIGTLNLLEATRAFCPEAVFIHVSTDKVYGERMWSTLEEKTTRYSSLTHEKGFDENLGLDFGSHRSFFGCSKAAADIYAQEYANEFGMKIGIFRPGCITGKNHEGAEQHGFLAYLAKCIKEGKTYNIYGYKGKQVRDQIHASDVAGAFYSFTQKPRVGAVYNIGGGPERSVSVLEAGELICLELADKGVIKPFLYRFEEARKGDRQWDVHDMTKFRTDYPEWKMKYSLSDIIKDICEK